jgi:outer membrane receptor protein involved in Fe transport
MPSIADYDKHIGYLKPETNIEFEFGLEGSYIDFNFKLSPYAKFIDDKINLVNVPPGSWDYFAQNAGKARILGVEARAVKTFGPYRATAIYALTDSKIKPYGEGGYIEAQYAPQQVFTFSNSLKIGRWKAIGILYAQSVQYSGKGKTGDKLPGYADLEFSLEKKIGDAVIFASANNLLDRRYAINGGYGTFYPCEGRTFKLGVRYQFRR